MSQPSSKQKLVQSQLELGNVVVGNEQILTVDLLDLLKNKTLINCVGKEVDANKAFRNKTMIAYYFSASTCGPCKQILPKLKDIYLKAQPLNAGLEVIYISSDKSEEQMLQYFKERHGGWYAIPFNDKAAESIRILLGITHIPQIVVVKADDGSLISRHGVKDINELGMNVLLAWNTDPV